MKSRNRVLWMAALMVGSVGPWAMADPYSPPVTTTAALNTTLTGVLPNEGTPLEIAITLPMAQNLTVYTTSYRTGGFEPNLSLYDSSGMFVTGEQYPGLGVPGADITDLDGAFTAPDLAAGNYTVTLTDFELQQDPSATNLSDGFTFNIGDGTDFVDEDGNTRTGNYTVSISTSPIPEPVTAAAMAMFGMGLVTRRQPRTMARAKRARR